MPIRLNKLLASRGLGARRKCDVLIESGSVRVNGTVVREPGRQVEPERDRVEVHGRPIPGRSLPRYFMLHKPVGVITTLDDPEGRPTVRALLPPGPRLFPVGRLDADTSGLLVVTNDGELAHHLMHPRYGVSKLYRVRLDYAPAPDQLGRLRGGVEFERGWVSGPCEVRVRNARPGRAEIEITLHEGRYRQVRRMCEAVGLTVRGLHRAAYGPLRLGPLPRGGWRELTRDEVRRLREVSARAVERRESGPPLPRGTARPSARRGRAGHPARPRLAGPISQGRGAGPFPSGRAATSPPQRRGAGPSHRGRTGPPPQRQGAGPSHRGRTGPPPRRQGAGPSKRGRPPGSWPGRSGANLPPGRRAAAAPPSRRAAGPLARRWDANGQAGPGSGAGRPGSGPRGRMGPFPGRPRRGRGPAGPRRGRTPRH